MKFFVDTADVAAIAELNDLGMVDGVTTNPSLIAKFHKARETGGNVLVWGDGSAQRDFLYVKDCAAAVQCIMQAASGPVNIGSGVVYRIRDVVDTLARITGMEDRVVWDASKPNGQDYRAYDLTRLDALGFAPTYSLEQGLRETWDWYCEATK